MKEIAIIMAGGTGTRLWPRSTEKQPKQYIHLVGDETMIQNTVKRLLPVFSPEDIYVVTTKALAKTAVLQLEMLPKENIIIEPFAKNTAPCVALGATVISKKYTDDTVLCCFPADHVISNNGEFYDSLETGCELAHSKKGIVTIGITPSRLETTFGYIQMKEDAKDLGDLYEHGVRYTSAFAEKPDSATAKRFIDSGDFLWNSGIFIWRLDTFWEAFAKFLPEHFPLFDNLKSHIGKDDFINAVQDVYKKIQSQSIDYAIMEKAKNVFVVKSTFNWSDLSNWDEIYRISRKDGRNNVVEGDVFSVNSSNCLVNSTGKMIGVVGVDNLIIIECDDSILICKRGMSDDVKEVVDYLKRKQLNKFL